MSDWISKLQRLGARDDAIAWCRTQPDLPTAWRNCHRGDWMLWLAGRVAGPPGHDSRRPLVLAACDCVEMSAHLADDQRQMAIAFVLTVARDWAEGGESTVEDCSHAGFAYASAAAALAAADATALAYASANVAYASAAAYAYASAATCAARGAARADALQQCADIVRWYYPDPPALEESDDE